MGSNFILRATMGKKRLTILPLLKPFFLFFPADRSVEESAKNGVHTRWFSRRPSGASVAERGSDVWDLAA